MSMRLSSIFLYIIIFLFGILIGSFLNVCIYRLSSKNTVHYSLVEGMNGTGYVLICMVHGICVDSILLCLFFSALLVASVIDWSTFKIPVVVNIAIMVLGIIRTAMDYTNIAEHLIGMICVSLFLLLLNLLTGGSVMGGGDVKLMAAAGLLLGWKQNLLAFWLGCLFGSVIHLCLMKFAGRGRQVALGPYLSAGMIISMLWGDALIQWYQGFI